MAKANNDPPKEKVMNEKNWKVFEEKNKKSKEGVTKV
jgi:hypothetical protein